ncbi:lumenal Hsp70 protein, partial [Ceratobasidium sp. 395]
MQLDYVKDLAGQVEGEKVRDVVVTVPAYFTQFQRQADGHRGQLRHDSPVPDQGTHIIYDSGASSTRATLVSFETKLVTSGTKKFLKLENVTQVTVLGSGHDTLASGTELTRRVHKLMVEQLPASLKDGLVDRSLAKLIKEAEHVKAVLSVNTNVKADVEGLVGDSDWKAKVERREFEKECEDLYWRFQQPILDAIVGTGVGLDVDSSGAWIVGVKFANSATCTSRASPGPFSHPWEDPRGNPGHPLTTDYAPESGWLEAAILGVSASVLMAHKDLLLATACSTYLGIKIELYGRAQKRHQQFLHLPFRPFSDLLLNDPHTVLSVAPTDTFTISSESGSPAFTGIQLKYVPSQAAALNQEDMFTVLAPGQSIDITHNLAGVYNFTLPGEGLYD